MSTQALGSNTGVPAGEAAIAQRVQQIQTLIEQARQASSTASSTPSGGFAATLQAASAAGEPYGSQAAVGLPSSGPYTEAEATSSPARYDSLVTQAAARYGLDPAVLHGLIQQESGFDPNSTSSAGAAGLTQLMPSTAASLGVTNPLDPAQSIEGGARYLSEMLTRFGGDTSKALAAYNAGPGAVQQYGGVPPYPETQSYVAKVLAYANAYRQSPASMTTGGIG